MEFKDGEYRLPLGKSRRLPGKDYGWPGAYFVTICTHMRKCLFGRVVQDKVQLNRFGRIVQSEWLKTPQIRPETRLGRFEIMSNHFHGIVWILPYPGWKPWADQDFWKGPRFGKRPKRSLGALVAGFKSVCTSQINRIRRTPGEEVWQINFFDHVIRDEEDLARIEQYIRDNPRHWAKDQFHEDEELPTENL